MEPTGSAKPNPKRAPPAGGLALHISGHAPITICIEEVTNLLHGASFIETCESRRTREVAPVEARIDKREDLRKARFSDVMLLNTI